MRAGQRASIARKKRRKKSHRARETAGTENSFGLDYRNVALPHDSSAAVLLLESEPPNVA